MRVHSRAGNWNVTATRAVTIIDDDAPIPMFVYEVDNASWPLVTFNANLSTDNIGVVSYHWSFTYNGTLIHLNTVLAKFNFWVPGNYSICLNVSDAAGNYNTTSFKINMHDTIAPVASAGQDISIQSGALASFDGSNSTDNVGITSYTWTFTYKGIVKTLYGPAASFRFLSPGNYTVALSVKDAAGNFATDTLVVRVSRAGVNPSSVYGIADFWWPIAILLIAMSILVASLLLSQPRRKF